MNALVVFARKLCIGSAVTEREYSAPPIIDAIIELTFEDSLSDQARERLSSKLAEQYPISEELVRQNVDLEVGTGSIATKATVIDRIVKRSNADASDFVTIGASRLNVSTGAPYPGWDNLFERFLAHWAVARKIWGYRRITRIGVRFINRIDLVSDDAGVVEYERYLNLRINLPESFPHINGYALAFGTILEDISCGVSVRSGIVPPAVPGRTSFTLDIDVWRAFDVPQKPKEVQRLLTEMRKSKNALFETFITDQAREIFNAV